MTTVDEVAGTCGQPWMPVATGAPPAAEATGWLTLEVLTGLPALRPLVATVLAECEGRRDVAAAFVAARVAVPLARLAVLPVLVHRRVLTYTPGGLWLRLDPRGLVTAVRVADAALDAPLPAAAGARDDVPAPPGAAPLSQEPAAPAIGRAHAAAGRAVVAYRPLVAGLRAAGGLGERALWGQLADAMVSAVGAVLAAQGATAAAAQHEALRWLRAADPPLWVRPEFAEVDAGGRSRLTWRRGSCCLAYRLAAFGLCDGCPLHPRAAWLAAARR